MNVCGGITVVPYIELLVKLMADLLLATLVETVGLPVIVKLRPQPLLSNHVVTVVPFATVEPVPVVSFPSIHSCKPGMSVGSKVEGVYVGAASL